MKTCIPSLRQAVLAVPLARAGVGGALRSVTLVSPLLRHRGVSLGVLMFAGLHLGLKASGHGGLPCPMRELSGVACPGCGLGTALVHLAGGEWKEALACHAFAPIFGAGLLLFGLVNVLPAGPRLRVIGHVGEWEDRTSFGVIFFSALLAYWLLRLG